MRRGGAKFAGTPRARTRARVRARAAGRRVKFAEMVRELRFSNATEEDAAASG